MVLKAMRIGSVVILLCAVFNFLMTAINYGKRITAITLGMTVAIEAVFWLVILLSFLAACALVIFAKRWLDRKK